MSEIHHMGKGSPGLTDIFHKIQERSKVVV